MLIYSSQPPEQVDAAQAAFGRETIGEAVEQAVAAIGVALRARGVRRLVIAGGETASAIVQGLALRRSESDRRLRWAFRGPRRSIHSLSLSL